MAKGDRQDFHRWFEDRGNDLLKGWLRAMQDGSEESFADWVLGEYECYLDDVDSYEIPYVSGLCDSPGLAEIMIFGDPK
jgi:hypothetical protein